ncbi:CPBP family intramembrane metalloprotease [Desulfosarcina sp. OttesenSCG-928-G10]|nr:CPBP family intramembrane metalloprotease [Desulfosarcina sp. OttesenSCG-928-G10]
MTSLPASSSYLPSDKTFQQSLIPYFGPYLVYVGVSMLPDTLASPETLQIIKLVATTAVMAVFFKTYRFSRPDFRYVWISLVMFPLALAAWLGPLWAMKVAGVIDTGEVASGRSMLYIGLRMINSVMLVAVFEELWIRVFVMQWLYQADRQRREKGLFGAVFDTLEQFPGPLAGLPVCVFSVVGAAVVFAAGHHVYEYPAAIVYFWVTHRVYRKTGNLWPCIFIHGLTNLAVGILALRPATAWLW